MHAFSKIQPSHLNIDNIPHNDRIELAIVNLESQDRPNYIIIIKILTISIQFQYFCLVINSI